MNSPINITTKQIQRLMHSCSELMGDLQSRKISPLNANEYLSEISEQASNMRQLMLDAYKEAKKLDLGEKTPELHEELTHLDHTIKRLGKILHQAQNIQPIDHAIEKTIEQMHQKIIEVSTKKLKTEITKQITLLNAMKETSQTKTLNNIQLIQANLSKIDKPMAKRSLAERQISPANALNRVMRSIELGSPEALFELSNLAIKDKEAKDKLIYLIIPNLNKKQVDLLNDPLQQKICLGNYFYHLGSEYRDLSYQWYKLAVTSALPNAEIVRKLIIQDHKFIEFLPEAFDVIFEYSVQTNDKSTLNDLQTLLTDVNFTNLLAEQAISGNHHALHHLKELAKNTPFGLTSLLNALSHLARKGDAQALVELKELADEKPRAFEYLIGALSDLAKNGNVKALNELKELSKQSPDALKVLLEVFEALAKSGSENALDELKDLAWENPHALLNLAVALTELAKNGNEAALEDLKKLAQRSRGALNLLLEVFEALAKSGSENALDELKDLAQEDSDALSSLLRALRALAENGNVKALDDLRVLSKQSPDAIGHLINTLSDLAKKGNVKALDELRELVKELPDGLESLLDVLIPLARSGSENALDVLKELAQDSLRIRRYLVRELKKLEKKGTKKAVST